MLRKANSFYNIQDAVDKGAIKTKEEFKSFHVDFSGYRGDFTEQRIYKHLKINSKGFKCNKSSRKQILFLAGHRGTGKTTELNRIASQINEHNCYYTVIFDIEGALDLNNLEFVDILIYMLETLVKSLDDDDISIDEKKLKPFYDWFSQRIEEVNKSKKAEIKVEAGVKAGLTIPLFSKMFLNVRTSLSGTSEAKEIIRNVFVNKFSDFALKVNEFLSDISLYLYEEGKANDLLFIIDGIEKIGTLDMRKKVLLDDSNKLQSIETNMIISLPIELMKEQGRFRNFSKIISFPVIKIQEPNGEYIEEVINHFKDFVYKRVDKSLFSSEEVVEKIIKYSGGSPRELLIIINEAYVEAEDDIIDDNAVENAVEGLSAIANYLTKKELDKLKEIKESLKKDVKVVYDDTLQELLEKKIVFEYNLDNYWRVNPIITKSRIYRSYILSDSWDIIENSQINNSKNKEKINSLSKIKIEDLYSIKNLEINNIEDKKEIYIVGENGDGKTLLLQGIILGLMGKVDDGTIFEFTKNIDPFISINDEFIFNGDKLVENIYAYGVSRNQVCEKKDDELGYLTLFDACIDLKDPVKWLQDLDYAEKGKEKNVLPLKTAINMLKELLDQNIDIKVSRNSVEFTERGSAVSFEHLSVGYKGVIRIISDLLWRLSKSQPNVKSSKDFKGVVLIDEVELHLHPKWEYTFASKLREYFPKIQFILTTHSPTVLLGASKEAVFYKIYKEDGEVKISNQIKNTGFTANTIISSPIFGLEGASSENYKGDFSSDDYVYEKIHKVVSERIKNIPEIGEDELLKMINDEFDKELGSDEEN